MQELLARLSGFLDVPYGRSAAIVGLALILAFLLRVILLPFLNRLARKTNSTIDDQILSRVNPAILQSVILEGLHWAAVDLVTDPFLESIFHGLAVTILVLLWGRVILHSGGLIFERLSRQDDRLAWIQPKTLPLVQFGFKVLLFGTMIYLIMAAWHFNLTSWLASAGVVGIAVGFAAKDTLANFISGIFILADAPYRVGQFIIIDDITRGVVTEIGMRSTRLLTRDNVEVTVPNAVIGNAKIVNESSGPSPRMRVRVTLGVAYGSDVEQVKTLLLDCARQVANTSREQDPSVRFTAMAESSLEFQVLVWITHPAFRGRVIDELNTRIYAELTAAGVEIPFPQRDLHIKSWPEGGSGLSGSETIG